MTFQSIFSNSLKDEYKILQNLKDKCHIIGCGTIHEDAVLLMTLSCKDFLRENQTQLYNQLIKIKNLKEIHTSKIPLRDKVE